MNIQKIFSICFFYALSTSLCIAMESNEVRLPKPETFLPHEMYTTAIAINPTKPEVAAVSTAGKVVIWDLNTCTVSHVFLSPEQATDKESKIGVETGTSCGSISYHPHGKLLAVGQPHGIYFYDLETNLTELHRPKSMPTALEFNHDGTMLVEGYRERLEIENLSTKQRITHDLGTLLPLQIKRMPDKTMHINMRDRNGNEMNIEKWDFQKIESPEREILKTYDLWYNNPLQDLSKNVKKTAVYAECTPHHKLIQLILLKPERHRYILVTDE